MHANLDDTIVALATPPGVGALGIIRLSGRKAIEYADNLFWGKKLANQESHTIHFGQIKDNSDHVVDEALAFLFKGPHSYTGEDVVEFSCHGSHYIIQKVIELLIDLGARMAEPGEFTLRAFLNGCMDLSQAEAVADLIASSSASSHDIAIKQMRGGFSGEIRELRQKLTDFASLIELELDFAEEDVEFANRDELKQLVARIRKVTGELIHSFSLGNVIKNGVTTVIAGRPNAGKSTLLNALLKEDRAIVSEIEGTTRDTIEEVLNINGINFRLIDTAGIREAQDQIEEIGVRKTMEQIQKSTILVYVFDVNFMTAESVQEDLEKLDTSGMKLIGVANKMDLNPYLRPEDFYGDHLSNANLITASALNNMNLEYLKEKLFSAVVEEGMNLDSPIVSNSRHYDSLVKTDQSLADAEKGMEEGISSDLVAMDIRRAISFLGEITGEITTEDLLGNIFSRFCIGK